MNRTVGREGETFFLNLRFILIVAVLVGSVIEPLISRMGIMHTLYLWIFTFHMPLFVLVTGYFAKASMFGRSGRMMLLQIAAQYVIFQTLYSLLDATVFHVQDIHRSFFAPYLLLWFLFSHFLWRLLFLSMSRLTAFRQLLAAVALGVLAGYLPVDGIWLSLSRTFVFFPFFVAGYHFSYGAFRRRFSAAIRTAAMTVSAALFAGLSLWGHLLPPGWLYGSMTYMQLGQESWNAGLLRLTVYMLQIVASAAFLAWVPMVSGRLTELGRRTLYVFLLHGFIIRVVDLSSLHESITGIGGALILVAAAVTCAILLAHPGLKRVLHYVIEPPVEVLLRLQPTAMRRFFVR